VISTHVTTQNVVLCNTMLRYVV